MINFFLQTLHMFLADICCVVGRGAVAAFFCLGETLLVFLSAGGTRGEMLVREAAGLTADFGVPTSTVKASFLLATSDGGEALFSA